MKQLWLCNLGWDEPISWQLYLHWRSLCDKLCLIGKIIVPRSIRCKSKAKIVELHGFADASETVSYTHLDVYKRQDKGQTECSMRL